MEDGAVLELDEQEVMEESATSTHDDTRLEHFNVDDYEEYINEVPEELQEELRSTLKNRRSGWQVRGRKLIRAKSGWQTYQRNMNGLVNTLMRANEYWAKRSARVPLKQLSARDAIRVWMVRMTETQLQELAEKTSVSWNSFMSTNDKSGLVEAILDEMLSS